MVLQKEYYDEYLRGEIDESQLIINLDILQSKTVKGDGVIYTPWDIVQEMIKIANPSDVTKIIEPSCGHGIFLIGLLLYIKEKYSFSGEKLLEWFTNKVTAVEITENTIVELKKILEFFFKRHFALNVSVDKFSNIICEDALKIQFQNKFDLCIGNPPYIRAKNLDNDYLKFLKRNFTSCNKGTIDIYYAFIERYMDLADEVVFITPNSFLTNKSGAVLKEKVLNNLNLLVDFKEKKVFKDASVYTCIFKTNQNVSEEIYYGNDLQNISQCLKSELWNNDKADEGYFQKVLSGIATLSDSVFLVKKINDKFYANFEGNNFEIEKGIVVPYLKLTKIKSEKDMDNHAYMICPYDKNNNILKEDILKENYPLAYSYLLNVKSKLAQRDKGKTEKYEAWYAYGRKQGLHTIKENFVINIPQMIGAECLPVRLNIEKILNEFGRFVFTSGYLIPEENNDKNYQILLGKKFINFAQKYGKIWPGKTENYFSLTVKQIKLFKG